MIDIEGHRRDSRRRLLGGSIWSPRYPVWTVGRVVRLVHLLSRTSQFFTFDFQSQSWRKTSNARPPAQRIDARRLLPTSPALSHLFCFDKKPIQRGARIRFVGCVFSNICFVFFFLCKYISHAKLSNWWWMSWTYLYTSRQSPSVSKRKYSSAGRSAHTSSTSTPSSLSWPCAKGEKVMKMVYGLVRT